MLQLKKYPENFSASRVAEVTISLMSDLRLISCFSKPNSTSVWIVLSWASSSMITEYWERFSSTRISRRSIPSVMYFITVSGPVQSSKRMA
uniref:ATP-dependent RNA helicase, putative n=1 Tax=Arundo donax TaxID=35708 RepID=A0A0A9E242_ARUDO